MEIELNKKLNAVKVSSKGKDIVNYDNYPVADLLGQLQNWLEEVTEENSICFIYKNENRSLFGTFRLEPRHIGWQFTSWNELERSEETLPLSQWKEIIQNAIQVVT